jgi:hypothetical protein
VAKTKILKKPRRRRRKIKNIFKVKRTLKKEIFNKKDIIFKLASLKNQIISY